MRLAIIVRRTFGKIWRAATGEALVLLVERLVMSKLWRGVRSVIGLEDVYWKE